MAGASPQATDALMGQAISERDVDAVLELFEADGVFIDADSGVVVRGHEQIRAALVTLFQFKPRLEGLPPTVFVAGDIALVIPRWTLELSGADGEVSRQSGTATDAMRRQLDGTWRYVIDNPQGVALG
jgi:uncharacterized protein (TIGR02246 family)